MSQRVPDKFMLSINRSNDQRSSAADEVRDLEQQMAALDLSAADKHFLRALHQTEKQLNEAFDAAQQSGDLQQQVSRIYKQLYRPD
jgi:hypothetical protein